MTQRMAYALGILALTLGMGCLKRSPASSTLNEKLADLAAWVPEEMEGLVVVSSLEAAKVSLEQLEFRSSWEPLREALKKFREGVKEKSGLDLLALSTWQEMGLHIRAPLLFGVHVNEKVGLFVLPVLDEALFLAALEKHGVSQGAWEAQPDMPQGLRAWKMDADDFVVWVQKPGHALLLVGNSLEVLQRAAQLSAEKSWAKHKEEMLEIGSRLPSDRVVSAWIHPHESRLKEVAWIGLAVTMQPRAKVVVDVTWRQGEEPFLPAMQTMPLDSEKWTQGLEGVLLGFWSSATWDWYVGMLKRYSSRGRDLDGAEEKLLELLTKRLNSPVLWRVWPQEATGAGDFWERLHWSVDFFFSKESDTEGFLSALAFLFSLEKAETAQAGFHIPVWQMRVGQQKLLVQVLDKSKLRIANGLHSYGHEETPHVLQKAVMQEMMRFPVAFAAHLNTLAKEKAVHAILGEGRMEKAEYMLLGLRAEEGHAQFVGEHFTETDFE